MPRDGSFYLSSEMLVMNRLIWQGNACEQYIDLLRNCLYVNFLELKDVLCASVFLLFIGDTCMSNDSSCSFVTGLDSWLLPFSYFLLWKDGEHLWNSKSLEQFKCLCIQQSKGYLCPVVRGWVAATANPRGAGGLLLLRVCVWLRIGSKHELLVSLRAWVGKSSKAQMWIVGCHELANMLMNEGYKMTSTSKQGKISSLLQRVWWDAPGCERKPQGFLRSGSTECSCG